VGIADSHRLKSERPAPRFDARGECGVIRLRYPVLHEPNHSRINLPDEAATTAFAARFAHILQPGLVIYLRGNLGAGKTTLVRALLQALGYSGRVKSPTYTLIERYEVAGLHLLHFDLYRFRDAEEWEGSGFRDEFDGRNICLVEWPEQATGLLPPADVSLTFEILQDGREVLLHAYTDAGQKCLNALPA
jgi:tRNA threonylcarbamoyladenosine biosynthesis protein TsaE